MLPPPHPSPLAPLRASSSSSLGPRLRLPFPSCPSSALPLLLSRSTRHRWPPLLRVQASGERVPRRGTAGLDALLSAAELLCLAPPAICSVVCAARLVFSPSSASAGPPSLVGGRLLVLQYLLLVGAVAIGSLIRRRQSGRRLRPAGGAKEGLGVRLVERMEKVEESVRVMVAAVGVLSRIVEKLGVRFRVLRRTLRDSISETATLAQKNSESTRILAAHEDLLEKEIGTIQKVLYAMQEQQQKQLDLILAIGEASTILGGEQDLLDGDRARSSSTDPTADIETKQAKINSGAVTGGNNRP